MLRSAGKSEAVLVPRGRTVEETAAQPHSPVHEVLQDCNQLECGFEQHPGAAARTTWKAEHPEGVGDSTAVVVHSPERSQDGMLDRRKCPVVGTADTVKTYLERSRVYEVGWCFAMMAECQVGEGIAVLPLHRVVGEAAK